MQVYTINGFIVFYINIGQLPFEKVEEHLKRAKQSYSKFAERIPENHALLWIPCRTRETSIEIIKFKGNDSEN